MSRTSIGVELTVGNDKEGKGGVSFEPNTYACRPPGALHGPFKSERGCVLLEILLRSRLDPDHRRRLPVPSPSR